MELFFSLCYKIIPCYVLIVCGFLAAKYYEVRKEAVANLAIYIITPAVVMLGTLQAGLAVNVLILPLCFLTIGTTLAFANYTLGKHLWEDNTRILLAFSSGTGNTGYFGIPVCIALLGPEALPIAVMLALGATLFENTVGYYLGARAESSVKEAFHKLLILPSLYAFAIGLLLNIFHLPLPAVLHDTLTLLKGAYTPLGMMLIGMGLAQVAWGKLDYKFILLALGNKWILWPLCGFGLVFLDHSLTHFFSPLIQQVFIIESVVPLAANTVALATRFNAYPEKAAVAVTLSTILGLVVVPVATTYLTGLIITAK